MHAGRSKRQARVSGEPVPVETCSCVDAEGRGNGHCGACHGAGIVEAGTLWSPGPELGELVNLWALVEGHGWMNATAYYGVPTVEMEEAAVRFVEIVQGELARLELEADEQRGRAMAARKKKG